MGFTYIHKVYKSYHSPIVNNMSDPKINKKYFIRAKELDCTLSQYESIQTLILTNYISLCINKGYSLIFCKKRYCPSVLIVCCYVVIVALYSECIFLFADNRQNIKIASSETF